MERLTTKVSKNKEGCPYCQEMKTLGFDAINDGIYIFRAKDEAVIESDTWEFDINYCPICGKALSGKARKPGMGEPEKACR